MARVRYTFQTITESGNWAQPESTSVSYATSKAELADRLIDWAELVSRYDDAPCSLMVWHGIHPNVQDLYPDMEATIGPRGGVRFAPC